MMTPGIARYWQSLRTEVRCYPWKGALLHMAADVVLVNLSLLSSFALWFLFYVVVLRVPDPLSLADVFKSFVTQ